MKTVKTVKELKALLATKGDDMLVFCMYHTGDGCGTCGIGDTAEGELEIVDLESKLVFQGS